MLGHGVAVVDISSSSLPSSVAEQFGKSEAGLPDLPVFAVQQQLCSAYYDTTRERVQPLYAKIDNNSSRFELGYIHPNEVDWD